jgi:hypothetical protein
VEVLFFFLSLELALTANGQRLVLEPHVNIVLLDAWHFELHHQLMLILVDIDRGNEVSHRERLLRIGVGPPEVIEDRVQPVLQHGNVAHGGTERNKSSHCGHSTLLITSSLGFVLPEAKRGAHAVLYLF